jgi:hypothetical protein
MHAINFDQSVEALHRMVAAHHDYLEDLRTESRPGHGRALSANVSVPSTDFDTSLSDLKALGRTDAIFAGWRGLCRKACDGKKTSDAFYVAKVSPTFRCSCWGTIKFS